MSGAFAASVWFLALGLRAFFAFAEALLISIPPNEDAGGTRAGDKEPASDRPADEGAPVRHRLAEDRDRLLGVSLIGATLSTAMSAVAVVILARPSAASLEWVGIALATGTIFVLFGDALPRALANADPERFIPRIALPLTIFRFLLFPLVVVVAGSSRIFARIFKHSGMRASLSREDLYALMAEGTGDGVKPTERAMVARVLRFADMRVEDVMRPLIEVHAVQDTRSLKEALPLFTTFGHSRIPVYKERIDRIVGLLFAFDILYADDLEASVRSLMRPGLYVPETSSIDKVLADLQRLHMGMAIVVDEYGGAVGIITMEDILEQIVGSIEDEFDKRQEGIRRIGAGEFVVPARVRIDDLERQLKISVPRGDYDTIGGLLLAKLGRIPRRGDSWSSGNALFTVRRATERGISEVHIKLR